MSKRFENKVVVVTGAAQGIGEAYARALARRGRGGRRGRPQRRVRRAGGQEIEADGGGALRAHRRRRRPSRRPRWPRRPWRRTAGSTGWSTTPRSTATWQFDLLISVDWDYYRKFMSVNMDGALVMTRAVYPRDAEARRRLDRQPELDRGLPLLRLLRPGQGRRQRPHPAARPRARRHEASGSTRSPPARPTPRPPAPRPATPPRTWSRAWRSSGWASPRTWSAPACSCSPTSRRG